MEKRLVMLTVNGVEVQAKKCLKCENIKALEEFSKQKLGLGGRRSRCKVCQKEDQSRTPEKGRKWTESKIKKEIQNLYNEGIDINYDNLKKINRKDLLNASRMYFGSYENAVNSSGFNYDKIKKFTYYSKVDVVSKIKDKFNNGESLSYSDNRNTHLQKSAKYYFGSWGSAIHEVGINYKDFLKTKKPLPKEEFDLIIKKMCHDKNNLNFNSIEQIVYKAAKRHYGSWQNAVETVLKKDYSEVRLRETWNRDKIIQYFNILKEKNESLCFGNIRHNHAAFMGAVEREFGNWKDFLEMNLGIDYLATLQSFHIYSRYGMQFEKLLDDIIRNLDIKYKKYNGIHKEIRPDYIFKNSCLGDAKLSEWTIYGSETIEKYEPYCKSLVIIFLRGNKTTDKMITKKTRLISVYKLVKQLPKNKRNIYLEKLNNLESLINKVPNKNSNKTYVPKRKNKIN